MPNGSTSPRGAAHREHEKRTGAYDENWPDWYSAYMAAEQSGTELPTCHQLVRAADLATRLGADEYIDSNATDPGAALQAMGGAATIVATAASGASMSPLVSGLVSGLAPGGRLVVVGAAPDPIEVQTSQLIFGTRSVAGSLTGSSSRTRTTCGWSNASASAP